MKQSRSYKFVRKSVSRQKKTKKQSRKLMKGGKCTTNKICLPTSISPLAGGIFKNTISKLLASQHDTDMTRKITDAADFTSGVAHGVADPFLNTPYDKDELVRKYYILKLPNTAVLGVHQYFFINKQEYDSQSELGSEAKRYNLYYLQDLKDHRAHATQLTITNTAGTNNAKVLISLNPSDNNTFFIFDNPPFPMKDRTIIDIDGTEEVKYEDSLLMAHVDMPAPPYTELSKTIIDKLLADPAKYVNKKITAVAGFTLAGAQNNIFHPSPYDTQKLLDNYHILSVFGKYFFITKPPIPAAGQQVIPYDVYMLQDLEEPIGTKLHIAGGDAKVICKLVPKNDKFEFGVASLQVMGRNPHDIIDLNGDADVKYEDSILITEITAPTPTKLSKGTIYRILSDPVTYAAKILDIATTNIPNMPGYEQNELDAKYHVLHVFNRHFFIPKTQYNGVVAAAAGANPVDPMKLVFDVYILQDLKDAANAQLQINPGGGATAGKVICKLEDKNNDGRFEFSDAAHPYPVMGRATPRNPIRTIVDLDGDNNCKYEESLLSTFVTAPAGAIPTELSKLLIHKILESSTRPYTTMNVTVAGHLAAPIGVTTPYSLPKLVDNYYVLNVFGKHFFITKDKYNTEKTQNPATAPDTWDYDVYMLQEARDPNAHGTRLQINGHDANILCRLETVDNGKKFNFNGGPFPLGGAHPRKIIDFDGRRILYEKSQYQQAVTNYAGPRTVRRSPSRRYSPRSRATPNYFTMNTIKLFAIVDIDNYPHQNPNTQIRSELHRTYVVPLGSPFKDNIYEKLSFYTVNDRLFCSVKEKEDEWGLFEVKKYETNNGGAGTINTFLITSCIPDIITKKGNPKYLLEPTAAPNPNNISIINAADYVIKTTSTNNLDNVEFLQWVDNGTDSTIKTQVDGYVAAAPLPP